MATTIKARKYVVKNTFKGLPKKYDFEVLEYELPPLRDGEILVKSEWLSVDPYQRYLNTILPAPYDQFGYNVGTVIESRDHEYPVGTKVFSHKGWCDYYIINKNAVGSLPIDVMYKLPDLQGLPESLGTGTVGMTGASAYLGFLNICEPKEGETVVVTGAAGAVGSIVGQIAKIKGCRVVGFTGADDKAKWLEEELGFDKPFNYKTVNVSEALKEAAPNGVDCYFDNVGGEISSVIINQMNEFGRVSVCGAISTYGDPNLPKVPIIQPALVSKQLKVQGFHMRDHSQWPKSFVQLVSWIKSGQLKAPEHITDGFDDAVDAFIGMLKGENKGKAVVKV